MTIKLHHLPNACRSKGSFDFRQGWPTGNAAGLTKMGISPMWKTSTLMRNEAALTGFKMRNQDFESVFLRIWPMRMWWKIVSRGHLWGSCRLFYSRLDGLVSTTRMFFDRQNWHANCSRKKKISSRLKAHLYPSLLMLLCGCAWKWGIPPLYSDSSWGTWVGCTVNPHSWILGQSLVSTENVRSSSKSAQITVGKQLIDDTKY